MDVFAVIPAKRFERAKSRLRERLDDRARVELVRGMFEHVLDVSMTAARAPRSDGAVHVAGVLVATDGEPVEALARARGAEVLRDGEPAPATLSAVIDRALAHLAARGEAAALVLMADLPLIQGEDLNALLGMLDTHDVVLAPDARGHGTNALALRLPAGFGTAFGDPESLAHHRERAHRRGLAVGLLRNDRLGCDVDLPSDLDAIARPEQAW